MMDDGHIKGDKTLADHIEAGMKKAIHPSIYVN